MKGFCEMYDLENLIKVPTCYKNVSNPSSINGMLTNKRLSLQKGVGVQKIPTLVLSNY